MRGPRHGQLAQVAPATAAASAGRRRPPGAGRRPRRGALGGSAAAAPLALGRRARAARRRRSRSQLRRRRARRPSSRVGRSRRRAASPYLRRSSRSSWRRARSRVQPLGVVVDAPRPRLAARRRRRPARRPATRSRTVQLGERRRARRGRPGAAPSASSGAAFAAQRGDRARGRRLAVGRRRRRARPPRRRARSSSSGSSMPARVDLVDLEAQQVDLAGPRAGVAAEAGQRARRCPAHLVAGGVRAARGRSPAKRSRASRCTRGATAATGGRAGRAGRPAGARLGQRAAGGQAAVDVGPRPAVGGDDPGEHDLRRRRLEAALDDRLRRRPVARAIGVGPAADEQLDRLDEHVLPAPVSPVSAVMPGPSTQARARR